MFSAAARRRRWRILACLVLAGQVLISPALDARAQDSLPPPQAPEAWLVTYGPGPIYWQRFGHNALWLREPGGLDHTFNFGFFDFEQENFLLRFVQGRMLYFAAAVPAGLEMAQYRQEGREIRAQRLNLSPTEYARLREHLVWHVQPENREYLYDYYRDNCSTRLRDALDLALDGRLSAGFSEQPAVQGFRDHTRRSTEDDPDYYLGLEVALGLPVDRPVSRWDEMFLPAVLAEALATVTREHEGADVALLSPGRVLSPAVHPPPPDRPGVTWPWFALLGCLLAGVMALLALAPRAAADGVALAWMLISGTLGLGLAAVWALTDHSAGSPNFNLLLFNPLWLLGVVPALRRFVAVALLIAGMAAIGVGLWPGGQYMADTLALFLPLNGVAAWRLGRARAATP